MSQKALRISAERLARSRYALINFDKVRIAHADHALRKHEAVHVNRDPAAVHEYEVGIPDQPEMVLPESLDEKFFRMAPKAEHFAVTRPELFLVHRCGLIRVPHVRLIRVRTCPRSIPIFVLSGAPNVRLPRLRFCLLLGLLLFGTRLFLFGRRSSLRFLRLFLPLLRFRRLA